MTTTQQEAMRLLMESQSVRLTARLSRVSESTIRRWRAQLCPSRLVTQLATRHLKSSISITAQSSPAQPDQKQ